MATTYEITAVRTVPGHSGLYGHRHEHIELVELSGRTDQHFRVSTIVADLQSPHGDRYYTFGDGRRADVIWRACPHCGERSYITTTPDSTTKNNLLELPRF